MTGSLDVGPQGKLRTFLSYPHCRVALDFMIGKTHQHARCENLIEYCPEAESVNLMEYKPTVRHQSVLGARTWIEYWPTEAECQTDEYKPTCSGIKGMVEQYTLFGCQQ
ncbi:complement C3-like [Xiphias gladius]|uniref:complement C3-like n=1 Tax=Xiphias gladius TaxID=8245 RepID=UPI001A995E57|nr:complement C3-like [Xiphias gladius]